MQIKNIKIFDSTVVANGPWIDISNLVAFSVYLTGLEGTDTHIEVSNDPDVNIDSPLNNVSAPAAPVLSQYAYGALTGQGTYFVKITYITKWGETTASAESSLAVNDGNVLRVDPPAPDAAGLVTGYNVYISKVSNTEVLQTMPPYTPAHTVDATPGIHYAISGAHPLNRPFTLQNGFKSSGIVVPAANTAGGIGSGVDITGNLAAAKAAVEEVGIFQNSTFTIASVNPSCLVWKWLRVVKANGNATQTLAWIMGQNG